MLIAFCLIQLASNTSVFAMTQNGERKISLWNAQNIMVMEILQSWGADINEKNENGDTLLHRVAEREDCSVNILKWYLDKGLDPNARGYKERTPLMCIKNRNIEKIAALIVAGADLELLQDNDGKTARDHLFFSSDEEYFKALDEYFRG